MTVKIGAQDSGKYIAQTVDFGIRIDIDFTNFDPVGTETYEVLELNAGTIIKQRELILRTAFAGRTTAVLDVGFDGDATLLDGANLKGTAGTVYSNKAGLGLTQATTTSPSDAATRTVLTRPRVLTLKIVTTGATAATAGLATLLIQTVEEGNSPFNMLWTPVRS